MRQATLPSFAGHQFGSQHPARLDRTPRAARARRSPHPSPRRARARRPARDRTRLPASASDAGPRASRPGRARAEPSARSVASASISKFSSSPCAAARRGRPTLRGRPRLRGGGSAWRSSGWANSTSIRLGRMRPMGRRAIRASTGARAARTWPRPRRRWERRPRPAGAGAA